MLKGYTHITLLIDSSGSMESIRDATITNYNKFIADQKKVEGKCTVSHYEFSSGSKKQFKNARPTRHLVDYLPVKFNPYQTLWNANPPVVDPMQPKPLWSGNTGAIPVTLGAVQANNIGQGIVAGGCVSIPTVFGPTGGQSISTSVPYPTTNEFSCVESFVDINVAQVLNREIYVPSSMTPLLDSIGRAIYETGETLSAMPEAERPEKVLFVIITDGAENASQEYSKEDVKAIIEHQTGKYGWDFVFLGANIDAVETGASYGISRGMSVNFAATSASVGGSSSVLSSKVATYRCLADVGAAKDSLNYSDYDRTVSLTGVAPAGNNSVASA